MQVIEILHRNKLGFIQNTRIVAQSITANPRNGDVEYFCVYKTDTPDFHSIAQVDRWGGTGGYFHRIMLSPKTDDKLRQQIKSKQVILL